MRYLKFLFLLALAATSFAGPKVSFKEIMKKFAVTTLRGSDESAIAIAKQDDEAMKGLKKLAKAFEKWDGKSKASADLVDGVNAMFQDVFKSNPDKFKQFLKDFNEVATVVNRGGDDALKKGLQGYARAMGFSGSRTKFRARGALGELKAAREFLGDLKEIEPKIRADHKLFRDLLLDSGPLVEVKTYTSAGASQLSSIKAQLGSHLKRVKNAAGQYPPRDGLKYRIFTENAADGVAESWKKELLEFAEPLIKKEWGDAEWSLFESKFDIKVKQL